MSRSTAPDQPPATAGAVPADTLARMVAHEVRNILTPVRVRAQLALEALDAHVGAEALGVVIRAADQIAAITDAILERAPVAPGPVDPVAVAREAVAITGASGVWIEPADDAPRTVVASRVALRHILINLILNAVRATDLGGGIIVRIERSTWNGGDACRIVVADRGGGMPASAIARLTGAPRGTDAPGVGLEVVRRLAGATGAGLSARNTAEGAEVALELSAAAPTPAAA